MAGSTAIAICGAGTGIGKTHVACALGAELIARGAPIVALKPVESGFIAAKSDAALLAAACGVPMAAPLYALEEPVSPHRAAAAAGLRIELPAILAWLERERAGRRAIVETAGGLLSPLDRQATNLDLLAALDPAAVVLVAADRLGALHDVGACALALGSKGLGDRLVVALSAPEAADAATGRNAADLRDLGYPAVIAFPRAALARADTRAAAAALAEAIEALA